MASKASGAAARKKKSQKGLTAGSKRKRRNSGSAVPSGDPKHRFNWQMLVWDDVYDKLIGDGGKATWLWTVSKLGLESFGSGAVLVRGKVRLVPRGSGSGFGAGAAARKATTNSGSSGRGSSSSDEEGESDGDVLPPPYDVITWEAKYLPAKWIESPELIPAVEEAGVKHAAAHDTMSHQGERVPLANHEDIRCVLGNVDRTRLLTISSLAIKGKRQTSQHCKGEGHAEESLPVDSGSNTHVAAVEAASEGHGNAEDPGDPKPEAENEAASYGNGKDPGNPELKAECNNNNNVHAAESESGTVSEEMAAAAVAAAVVGGDGIEAPYDPDFGELVLLLAVEVEGERRPVVGADVVKAIFDSEDNSNIREREEGEGERQGQIGYSHGAGNGQGEPFSLDGTEIDSHHQSGDHHNLGSPDRVLRLEIRGVSDLLAL